MFIHQNVRVATVIEEQRMAERLWRRNKEIGQPRVDVLHGQAVALRTALDEAGRLKLLDTVDGERYATPVSLALSYGEGKDKQRRSIKVEAHTKQRDRGTYLALKEEGSGDEPEVTSYYRIDPNGTVVDLDMERAIESSGDEHNLLKTVMEDMTERLTKSVYEERDSRKWARRDRIVLVGKIALIAGIALPAAGGIYAWIVEGAIKPAAAAEEHREDYDAEGHDLPGEGVLVDTHPFALVPSNVFDDIPEYGGSDTNLDNPRTFEFDENGCISLPKTVTEEDKLVVALPDESLYANYHYGTLIVDDHIAVCTVEALPAEDSDGYSVSIDVAVQAK